MSALTGLITLDRQSAARSQAAASPMVTAAAAPLDFSLMLLQGTPQSTLPSAGTGLPLSGAVRPPVQGGSAQDTVPLMHPILPQVLASAGGNRLPLAGEELPPVDAVAAESTAAELVLEPALLPAASVAEPVGAVGFPALGDTSADTSLQPASVNLSHGAASGMVLSGNSEAAPPTEPAGHAARSAVAETTGLQAVLIDTVNPALQPASAEAGADTAAATTTLTAASSAASATAGAPDVLFTPLDAERTVRLHHPVTNEETSSPHIQHPATVAPAGTVSLLNEMQSLDAAERSRNWRTATITAASLGAEAVTVRPPLVQPGQLQLFAEQLQATMQAPADPAAAVPAPTAASPEELPGTPLRQESAAASAPTQARTPPAAAFNPHTFSQTLGHGFDEPQWGESFARHISLLTGQKVSSAQVQLDPPGLGSLLVRINISGDQASISFVSPHAQVRDSIEQSFDRLQGMLSEQGLDLVDVDVSDRSFQEREGEQEHRSSDSPLDTAHDAEQTSSVRQVGLVDYYI